MYRSRSSLPYDILHGIQFSSNISIMLSYLSYFPPPPPILPGPPPRRLWTCSSHSFSSLSCFVSDDRNPPSLRQYIPLIDNNQSTLSPNISHTSINSSYPIKSSSLYDYIVNLFQNQFLLFLFLIVLLSILLFLIILLILFRYFQHHRQRHITQNNKNKKFYYHLIPHRQKHQSTLNNNEYNLEHIKDSSTPQVISISIPSELHTNNNNNNNETEEHL